MTTKGILKFLIDTGANKNYISNDHVVIENCIEEPDLTVTNVNGTFNINKSVSFDIFGIKKKIKFYIFKFHKFFDGLIGYETLRDLNASFNIGKNVLKISRKTFTLQKKYPDTQQINFMEGNQQFAEIIIPGSTEFLIEEEIDFENFKILPGLYKSKNGSAIVAVKRNSGDSSCIINTHELMKNTNHNDYQVLKKMNHTKKPFCDTKIRNDHMNAEETKILSETINKYREILYDENSKLTFTHKIKHRIRTADNIPIHTKSYKYPQIFENEVQEQVRKMLNDGIIRESISPYTSPVWVVPKKADASGKKKFRLVIDYRKLNEKTINDRYPIPEITDILDKLGRACYFSTIDLVSGFHQIQLENEDIEKTAFSVNGGKYEFTRMPFGLKNAPATFQRVMDCILRECIGKFCFVYMDDIIIFSPSLQQHKNDLSKILGKLKDANLKIQLDKCEFFRKEVQFLGHTVTENGVKPNSDKIKAISSWPIPRTEKDLRQFLGILGYYRRFIKDFAKLVKPLTNLLRKDTEIIITPEIIECFEKCKKILTLDPILIHPDFSKEFILTTDASDFAIGAVLSQGTIGKDRPIAYASRTLNKTEERYSTIEKELLAIVWAIKEFRHYLYGRKFKLYTDHQPLTYSLTNANNKIIRWRLALEEFDYEIIYKPGKQNVVADALSRIKTEEINFNEQSPEEASDSDDMTVHSADTSDDYFIPCTERPINVFRNQLIFKIANIELTAYEQVFPKYHRHTIVKEQFNEENIVEIFKQKLNPRGVNCIKLPISIAQLVQETFKKHFSSNKIFKVFISETLLEDVRMGNEQDEIVRETHNYGHRGVKENRNQILQKYFFPQLDRKIKIFNNSCEVCKKAKYNRKPPKLIHKSNFGLKPFDRVHIDIFFLKGQKWLTIVDSFSKFANAIPLETRTIVDVKNAISEHIRHYGRPSTVVSDQEPTFRSIDLMGFLEDLGIEMHFASNSNANGIVERFHSTLIEIYRTTKTKFNDLTLKDHINIAIDIYNNTFHEATKQRPREIIFNVTNTTNTEEIREKSNRLQSAVKTELTKRKVKYENKNKHNEIPKQFNPGEDKYVKIAQRLTKDKDPFKIFTVKTDNTLTFEDKNNIKIHKNRVKN